MTAVFKTKNVYGNDLIYPANELAQTLTELTGKKTLSQYDLDLIKKAGITVYVDNQPPTLFAN